MSVRLDRLCFPGGWQYFWYLLGRTYTCDRARAERDAEAARGCP